MILCDWFGPAEECLQNRLRKVPASSGCLFLFGMDRRWLDCRITLESEIIKWVAAILQTREE